MDRSLIKTEGRKAARRLLTLDALLVIGLDLLFVGVIALCAQLMMLAAHALALSLNRVLLDPTLLSKSPGLAAYNLVMLQHAGTTAGAWALGIILTFALGLALTSDAQWLIAAKRPLLRWSSLWMLLSDTLLCSSLCALSLLGALFLFKPSQTPLTLALLWLIGTHLHLSLRIGNSTRPSASFAESIKRIGLCKEKGWRWITSYATLLLALFCTLILSGFLLGLHVGFLGWVVLLIALCWWRFFTVGIFDEATIKQKGVKNAQKKSSSKHTRRKTSRKSRSRR